MRWRKHRMEELKDSVVEEKIGFKNKWKNWNDFKKTWSYAERLRVTR